ncbi:MAG: LysR family transcriptional regulator, partial [Robiginitomaculum sp.]
MNNWSDYPIFMAIAQTGSLTAAGQSLGISQPTVGRRLKALEGHFGGPLLRKEDGRLVPTEFGYQVLDHVGRMNDEAAAIERSSATLEHSLSGPVHISASQGMGDHWLPYAMQSFREVNPDIIVDVSVNMRTANLAQREADIALRWGGPGTQNSLIGRKVVSCGFGLYAGRGYIERHGMPKKSAEIIDHDGCTVTLDGHDLMWKRIVDESLLIPRRFTFRTDSVEAHKNAIEAGYGIGPLPHCGLGGRDVVRVLPEFEQVMDLWVVAHEDLRKSARIRAAFDFLIGALQDDSAHFRFGEQSCFE